MIQNIVFDMGNVLILYDVNSIMEKTVHTEEDRALLTNELFGSVEWLQMDRGVLDEAGTVASICARLPAHLRAVAQSLIENWHADIPGFPEMDSLVHELKQNGYTLYLLSNTSKKFHSFRKGIPALQHFTGEFISADFGVLKPDLAIYKAFFKHFSLAPDSCFFIDDAPANIESSIAAGMQGFIFRKNVPPLRAALIAAGVNVGAEPAT